MEGQVFNSSIVIERGRDRTICEGAFERTGCDPRYGLSHFPATLGPLRY